MTEAPPQPLSGSRGSMVDPELLIFNGLSVAARNGLKNGIPGWKPAHLTDEIIRDWIRETGTKEMLRLPNLGPKTVQEICDAFGVTPDEPRDAMNPQVRYLLSLLDAETVEEAVGIINRAGRLDTSDWVRDRNALIARLHGRTNQEIGAEIGVSASRVGALAKRAVDQVRRTIWAQQGHRLTLSLLPHRAQTGLRALGMRTDAQVLVHLRLFGADRLRETAGVGPATAQEICNAFGFRPETDQHPAPLETIARTSWTEQELAAAVHASGLSASRMRQSALCACFRCVALFPGEWLFGSFERAWCPRCGAHAVLPGAEVPEIRNPAFLRAMQRTPPT